eukprot:scaffold4219_cov103-Isochrysis_galbana.AAC.4
MRGRADRCGCAGNRADPGRAKPRLLRSPPSRRPPHREQGVCGASSPLPRHTTAISSHGVAPSSHAIPPQPHATRNPTIAYIPITFPIK